MHYVFSLGVEPVWCTKNHPVHHFIPIGDGSKVTIPYACLQNAKTLHHGQHSIFPYPKLASRKRLQHQKEEELREMVFNTQIVLTYAYYDQTTQKILGTSTMGNVIRRGTIEYHRHNIMIVEMVM